jgi:hypothetical protein
MAKKAGTTEDKELIPAEGDKDVGTTVFEILGEIISDKNAQGLHCTWTERYRLSRNMPWKNDTKKVPLTTANLLFTHRQRTVNTLTDNDPTFNLAKTGNVGDIAEDAFTNLMRASEHWWREQEQQAILEMSVNDGEMYGCAIEKVTFDPDLEFGIGEVRTTNVDAFHFGVYPVDTKVNNQDAEANLHFYPMTVRKARRMWPDKAKEIQADDDLIKELGNDRRFIGGENKNDSKLRGLLNAVATAFGAGGDLTTKGEQTLVVECYVKDYTMEPTGEEEDRDGEMFAITKPKYPGHIRRITVCNGGKCVLEDVPNPNVNPTLMEESPEQARATYLFDRFPFTLVQSIKDSQTIWGQSDWEQLEGLQKEFSKTLSQYTFFKDRSVRPKIINPKSSGVHNDEFSNSINILNPTDDQLGAGIRYMTMDNNNLMAEMQNAINLIRELFFLVAGTFELEQAQTGQVTAYKAIAALMEHAATMMRGKIRSYQRLVRERGRMYISHVQNFYTEERWVSFEQDGVTETVAINGRDMLVPAKLTVVSGSTLPRAQIQEREEALLMFDKGLIDQMETLKRLDYPGRAEVIKRMQAGPLGELLNRLATAEMDPLLLQAVEAIGQMDQKEFATAMKNKEIPPLNADPNAQTKQQAIDAATEETELRQLMAETDLAVEKVVSERVDQQVKIQGVDFDQQNLDIMRDKIRTDYLSELSKNTYNERGLASNNKEITA